MRRLKKDIPKGYDSWLEWDLHRDSLQGCELHTHEIDYVQYKTYIPDFIYNSVIFIEVKGRFRTSAEARKYIDVRESLGTEEELVFIFADPKKPMPGARRRKDGTRRTHAEWADTHGFKYYSRDNVPKEFNI